MANLTDTVPELIKLRQRAAWLFVYLLWAHVPIVAILGLTYRTGWIGGASIAIALAALANAAVAYRPTASWTRATIAVALTGMPILFVYCAQGLWQVDFHMYFFAVFAMLAAFCDWRPIVIAAVITSLHHVILDKIAPHAVFPSELGAGRVALHAGVVFIECGVLLWIIAQLRALFRASGAARVLAEERLEDAERVSEALARNALLEAEISVRKGTEAFLVHAAYHDDLTGLRSRSYFIDALAESIGRATGSRERFAVLFIDLDRFKLVNDSLGHVQGDALLVGIAERVRSSLRPGDTLARLGGDEFAVLLEDVADETQAIAVAQRIELALRAPFELGETEVFSSASIGIALGTDDVESPEHILHDADCAMYEAKRANGGRGGHAVYEEAMHANAKAALRLQTDLQHALERSEFRLHYQPIVRLDTERVVGFEALVRWQHPGRGLIYPGEFIATAEETGLIVGIGAWVLREACMQMHEWEIAYGGAGLCVMSVNVSSRQLTQQSFYEDVLAVIGETGVDPRCIELEITESVLLVNADLVGRTLVKLRALGFRIALDDFGTGYSSLSYLQRYNVDTLKIDQSFVRGIDGVSCNKDLIKTFVALSDALGLNVVAEGVETAEQCETVRALGCSFAQGYYFAKPQPNAEITRLIAALDRDRMLAAG